MGPPDPDDPNKAQPPGRDVARIFIGGIATETSTFSPVPKGLSDFQSCGVFHGDATAHAPSHFTAPLHVWRRRAEADGHEVIEGLMAFAEPGGTTTRAAWSALKARLLLDVAAAGPCDAILLNLHGAMIADGEDDCEGDLLDGVRRLAGPHVVIAAELDLHCHLTARMVEAADILVTYKEYPHTDIVATAENLYDLTIRILGGDLRPVPAVCDCHMLNVWPTVTQPMNNFVDRMRAREADGSGVASVSFCHGFSLADIPETGSRVLVYAHDDPDLARSEADDFARQIWEMREHTRRVTCDEEEGLTRALAVGRGPVVIADTADNPGAGAGGDSTFLLREILRRGVTGVASGLHYDPMAVSICRNAGVGARLHLRIGGKLGPLSGPPLDLEVVVRALADEHSQASVGGQRTRLGAAAWIEAEGVHIVLCERRSQALNPDAFTGLGMTLTDKTLICVKSIQHFHAGFAPIAAAIIYVRTSAAIRFDDPVSPYRRRSADYWPRVDRPAGVPW